MSQPKGPTPPPTGPTVVERSRPQAPQVPGCGTAMYGAAAPAATAVAGRAASTGIGPGAMLADRYKVIDKIGEGDTGEVYLVTHVPLGKTYALKVVLAELSADSAVVDRFKREAIAASRIGHPNIVDIADSGRTDDGRFFFVMEHLQGDTLETSFRLGAMPIHRALRVALHIAHALSAAHQRGIIHRDLKPKNVHLIERDGRRDIAKVLGFGLAKVSSGFSVGARTGAGVVIGSPGYSAPEQAACKPIDARADIYSLGVMLYEMLCGRPLFTGETPAIVMAKHLDEAPPSMMQGPPHPVPPALEALVMSMIAKSPERRPQTMEAVVHSLEKIRQETMPRPPSLSDHPAVFSPAAPSRESDPVHRARALYRGTWMVASAATLLCVTAAGVVLLRPPPAPVAALAAPAPAAAVVVTAKPEQVSVSLRSTPARADVYEEEVLLGQTPMKLEWDARRQRRLTFMARGFEPEVRTIAPLMDLDLEIELRPPPRTVTPGKRKAELKDPH